MRDVASAYYHSLHQSGTPPLLPTPLPAPSTSRRVDIPKADTPSRKRLLLTTPRPSGEVDVCTRESSEFCTRHHDAQTDRAAVRAEIEILKEKETCLRARGPCEAEHSGHIGGTLVAVPRLGYIVATIMSVKFLRVTLKASKRKWHQKEPRVPSPLCRNVTQPGMALIAILRERGGALTWWNSHVMTVTHDVAYAMTWVDLRKKMTDKYCPRNEMKKLEAELWNLKVIGTDVVKYNQRFQELALLCVRMFPEESDKIERYVGGLPDMIHGNIVASKPKTMQEAIEMATELMDKRVSTIAERQAENKRKFENTSRNNQNQQQQQNKRQNTGRAYTTGSGDKKQYGGSRPLCSKCNYHHDGPCAPKCYKCNKYGHIARDCRGTGNANNINNQKGTGSGQKPTCFECGVQGHFKKECPRMKNNKGNRGNQAGNHGAPAKVYVVGNARANPDNVIAAPKLTSLYVHLAPNDITPSTLAAIKDVELAD
ncbi:reverse transcriptase domain-containing protein [Tanacetum coccineum]